MDYQTARDRYQRMTKIAPEHPAGYVYLANNLWLETLNQSRRLTSSTYTTGSFYAQDKDEDKVDPKRDQEFNALIKQAMAATRARLLKNKDDAEALYYEASALGLRAGYGTTVKRSFVRAIGDANDSVQIQKKVIKVDPNYTDSYLSIGLYEYVIDSLPFSWRFLARLAGLKGSKKKGIEHLEMVTQKGKYTADDARVVLIGIYSKEGQPERALELISQLATKYPRNYLFGIERAGMLYNMSRADDGSRAFEGLLKDERIAGQAADLVNYQWGEALAAKGDYAKAVERYNEVARWPKSDEGLVSLAHLHSGQSLDAMGKRDEAIAQYQTVLKRENVFDSHKLASQYVKKPYAPSKG
ncbi:MAG TPA: tetratricopeptide repeat protein [Blastocatellia bacterium]|nr:tetratricopeptide repeat protein [Blastocatellia bacterium]